MLTRSEEAVPQNPTDEIEHLRDCLDEVCDEIAEKYGLYDSKGNPRRAFILNTLLKYGCRGCIVKVFTQLRKADNVDRLFLQNHMLATNLLFEQLYDRLAMGNLKCRVDLEVDGKYGRPDIVLKLTNTGLFIKIGEIEIIAEVKTGAGFEYSQILRYLIERPHAIIMLWRVTQRQNIVIKGSEIHELLVLAMESALNRGRDVLRNRHECNHNLVHDQPRLINDAQVIVDNILPSLPKAIQSAVNTIFSIIESTGVREAT